MNDATTNGEMTEKASSESRESDRRAEYVTDVNYVRAFEGDLSPARLRLVAALNGFVPPAADAFDYCELGSASGDTIATLAGAYPRSRFVGVDVNPDHIAAADALADAGKLENVRFLERDFAALSTVDLPALDYVSAHGVLSWVGPDKRKAVIDIASRKLKQGGLLYVSYNALPGWAQLEPLRQLIVSRGEMVGGSSLDRARAGLDLAKLMKECGAEYFQSNPAAAAMLKTIDRLGLPYVVHEYLHAHWTPMYFAQVAAEMAASDLYFVGPLPLYLNYRDLAIPEPLQPLFRGIDDRVTFESLKDFALNEFFRRDVYVKGRMPRSEDATRAYLEDAVFGYVPTAVPSEGARELRLPHRTLRFMGALFDTLLPALDDGAATVASLAARPELAPFGSRRIGDALLRLSLGEHIAPMRQPTFALRTPIEGLLALPLAYNRAVVHDALARGASVALASTVLGNGVEISVVEAVAIVLLTEVAPRDRTAWLADLAANASWRLKVRDEVVSGAPDRARVLEEEIRQFQSARLPRMLDLGILTRG